MPAIDVTGLRKRYRRLLRPPVDALRGVDLSVPEGSAFGLIGPNGAGKTTFIKSLRARLNLDVSSDFALTVGLKGPDAARTADMAKAIGAAMALARFEAQSQGQTEFARVLEYAGTSAMNDHLGVKLAVPLEVLRQELSWCRGASASGSTDAGSPAPSR